MTTTTFPTAPLVSVDTSKPVWAGSINPEFLRKCREAAEARRKKGAK